LTPANEVAAPQPKRVSVVIVSFNRADQLRQSLASLGDVHQVLVVDNGSTDGSAALETEFRGARFIRLPKNFGLTKALNIGIRAAEGQYILLLHDDTQITGDAVSRMADFLAAREDVGAVAPLLTAEAGERAPQIRPLPTPAAPDPPLQPATGGEEIMAECVSGAAIMFRTFYLRALRQIDERYGVYGSAVELCAQVRRSGKKIVILNDVKAIHYGLRSPLSRADLEGDRAAGTAGFLGKHYGFMAGLLYRIKTGLAAALTFRFKVAAGAFAGQKVDGGAS
jgi:N-acetylglucosaminyl-diphospho-decaprenol L-rhamnosyltransferase